jgi:SAM-dependent methyltransferase
MAGSLIKRAPLGAFLAQNPFPNGWTDGLFYREKMRAIHFISPKVIAHDDRILEIGGGRSGMAAKLYPGADITTLDLDPAHQAHQPAAQRTRFVCGDARDLPFATDQFAVVTMFDVIEHIVEDHQAASEALRVTRPGGHVLVSTPDADWHYPMYGWLQRFSPDERELMEDWGHVRRGYTPTRLAELFGTDPVAAANFINPITAFYHDVAFSRLRPKPRKLLYALAAPLVLGAYALHRPTTKGTEMAAAWRK